MNNSNKYDNVNFKIYSNFQTNVIYHIVSMLAFIL